MEFGDSQMRDALASWETEMPEGKSVDHLMRSLGDRPRIKALAKNPLMLTIIAYLYCDTQFVLPYSRAEFYEHATSLLLEEWHLDRNRYKGADKTLVLQHVALQGLDGDPRDRHDPRTTDHENMMECLRNVLPKLNLDVENNCRGVLDEIIHRSGLLLSVDGGRAYQFAHLSLQEYFAARELRGKPELVYKRFVARPDRWREAVKLWCGLDNDCSGLIDMLFGTDPLTAFECLADARKVDPAVAERVLDHFKELLRTAQCSDDALRAFGLLAAGPRHRGSEALSYLTELITSDTVPDRTGPAQALAYTNLPEAAEALKEGCRRDANLVLELAGMGDVAVMVLVALARQGVLEAIDALGNIGTEEAMRQLELLTESKSEEVAASAVWRLLNLPSMSSSAPVLLYLTPYRQPRVRVRLGPFVTMGAELVMVVRKRFPAFYGAVRYLHNVFVSSILGLEEPELVGAVLPKRDSDVGRLSTGKCLNYALFPREAATLASILGEYTAETRNVVTPYMIFTGAVHIRPWYSEALRGKSTLRSIHAGALGVRLSFTTSYVVPSHHWLSGLIREDFKKRLLEAIRMDRRIQRMRDERLS